jgi:hypothetical protein
MKSILEFSLPDDQREYQIHIQAENMLGMLQNISDYLRSSQKYGNDFKDAADALNKIREQFYWAVNEFDVNLDL